jgi:hypothetical protein
VEVAGRVILPLSVNSNTGQDTFPENCCGSNFEFSILTFDFLTVVSLLSIHVLMVLSIGGIVNAMLLPEVVFFSFYSSMQHFNRKSAIGVKFSRRFFP